MRLNEKYEKELNLRDLLFHILYHWRIILSVALGFAILFGGLQYLSKEKVEAVDDKNTEAIEYYNRNKAHREREVERYKELREQYQTYLDNAIIMKLDAMNMFCSKKSYHVIIDSSDADVRSKENLFDLADAVLQVYGFAMDQDKDEGELAEAFGATEMSYIREIASIEVDRERNQLIVTVHAGTAKDAEKGRNYISKRVESLEPKAQEIAPHKLEVVGEGTYPDSDQKFLQIQQNHISDYNAANNSYEEAISRLNSLQEPVEIKPASMVSRRTLVINKVLIGFAAGFLLMLFIITCRYLMDGKLHSGRELANQYLIPIIGEMRQSRAWNKGKGIDKMIESLEFRKNQRTDESVYQNMASLLNNWKEVKNIALVSTLSEKDVKEVQNQLQARTESKNIVLSANFLNNQDAFGSVINADVVLVLEKKYKTLSSDVTQMAGMLQVGNSDVVGAIVL